jgi:predicted helicase
MTNLFRAFGARNLNYASPGPLAQAVTFRALGASGRCGEGVIEQIDGLIEIDGQLYLVEVKWWNTSLGVSEVSPHVVRVYGRGGVAYGLFISYTDFTSAALKTFRDATIQGRVITFAKLQEIIELLEREGDIKSWIKQKVRVAIADK